MSKSTKTIGVRVPVSEYKKIIDYAERHRITVSEFILSRIFGPGGELAGLGETTDQRKLTKKEKEQIFSEELDQLLNGLDDLSFDQDDQKEVGRNEEEEKRQKAREVKQKMAVRTKKRI